MAPLFYPSLAFLMGVVVSYFQQPLDLRVGLVLLGGIVLGEVRDVRWRPWRRLFMIVIFGMAWAFYKKEVPPDFKKGTPLVLVGVVEGEVKKRGRFQTFDFKTDDGNRISVSTEDPRAFELDDRLRISGSLQGWESPKNPGEFDLKSWNESRGVYGKMFSNNLEVLESHQVSWRGRFFKWRCSVKELLSAGNTNWGMEQALIDGMVLGDVSGLEESVKDDFRNTGTGHIFAVSGQNLGVILGFLVGLVSWMGVNRWRWGWMALVPLLVYAGLTGFQSSCIRAWIMVALLLVAWRVDRPVAWLNFWSLGLILVLLWNPDSIRDLGYQLSFLVVLGLILLTSKGMDWIKKWWEWNPLLSRDYSTPIQRLHFSFRYSVCSMGVGSTVAFLMVLPHSVFLFHQVNLISIPLNLMVLPLAGLVVGIGSAAILMGGLYSGFAVVLGKINLVLAKWILFMVHLSAGWGSFQMAVPDARTWRLDRSPEWVVIDSGESCMAFLRYRGENWLVNCGGKKRYEKTLKPLLKYYGVNSIDGIILTTVSESNNGALPEVLESFRVKKILRPLQESRSPLEKRLRERRSLDELPIQRMGFGDHYVFGSDFRVEVINSLESELGPEEKGLMLDFEDRGRHFLWMNRVGGEYERSWLNLEMERRVCSVVFQGSDLRRTNMTEEWVKWWNPEHWIIPESLKSYGKKYDYPLREIVFPSKTRTWALDKRGAIIVRLHESPQRMLSSWEDAIY